MKDKLIKEDINYPGNFFKLLTPRQEKNKMAFEGILYPEKKEEPLSKEIMNRTKIVSELSNSIDRILIENDEYFKKLNEMNLNYSYNSTEKNIKNYKKNFLKKKSIIPTSLYDAIKKRNSYYLDKFKNKRISKSKNFYPLFLKQNLPKKDIKINQRKDKISSYGEHNKILLKKVKQPLLSKKINKHILSRNQSLIPSNLTDVSTKNILYNNDKKMKKAISSSLLSEKSIKFNQNKTSDSFYSRNFIPINRMESSKNGLKILKQGISNPTFTNFITGYKSTKIINNNFNFLTQVNNSNFSSDKLYNSNKNIINSPSKTNTYNNYNLIFSEEDKSYKQIDTNVENNKFSSPIISLNQCNKLNLLNKDNNNNPNNLNKVSINFKNFFNNKLKSLNIMTHKSNRALIDLIDVNNQKIKVSKAKVMKKNEELEDELDIRKDIFNEEEGKKLSEKKTYKLIQEKDFQIKSLNQLKKKINKISESDALEIIEKCIDKNEKEKLDVNKLLNERYDRKKKKELLNIVEIRKKAEQNYKIIIKMKYNL